MSVPTLNAKPEKVPDPLRDWILAEVRKLGNESGLILPDGADGTEELVAVKVGPDVEGVKPGDALETNAKIALSRAVRISKVHFLLPSDIVIGVYRGAQ